MLINNLIDKLNWASDDYFRRLSSKGFNVERDEIKGELSIALVEAIRNYETSNYTVKLGTIVAAFFKNRMRNYVRKLFIQQRSFCDVQNTIEPSVEADTGVRLIISEIDAKLSTRDSTTFNYMLTNESKPDGSMKDSIYRVRETARQVMGIK